MSIKTVKQRGWNASGVSHVGKIRRSNEDSICLMSEQNLWLVADGMGGHAAGALSSQAIVNQFESYLATQLVGHNAHNILARLAKTNLDLTEYAKNNDLGIIGSTVAVLSIHQNSALAVWAGDSRIYRIRDNAMHQITVDHDQVTELIDMGLSDEQVRAVPSSEGILRAIGSDEKQQAQVTMFEVQKNDRFLLCTDGLSKELDDQEVAAIACNNNAEDTVSKLLRRCLASIARDNISIIVVE